MRSFHHRAMHTALLAVLTMGALTGFQTGCAWEEERSVGDGESGELQLAHSATVENFCGTDAREPTCDYPVGCDETNLRLGVHDLRVARFVEIASGNGLGDSHTIHEFRDIASKAQTTIEVVPESGARVENIRHCDDALRFDLVVDQLEAFTLRVRTGEHRDRWRIEPVEECVYCS